MVGELDSGGLFISAAVSTRSDQLLNLQIKCEIKITCQNVELITVV